MTESRIPVIVSRRRIDFPIGESNPQMFTLFNPYDYIIKYRVLATSPTSYEVGSHSGFIDPNCCKDFTVRCKLTMEVGNVDKLRVEIKPKHTSNMYGSKEIELVTTARSTESSKRPNISDLTNAPAIHANEPRAADAQDLNQAPYLVVGLLCAVALVLPTVHEPGAANSNIPEYFHLTLPQKLVAAYILGIISILLIRPT
ncbi:unnamed protein product [Auanema sp. JU1783]|nr:unnamed protein product [Auanema sp. JU1783]